MTQRPRSIICAIDFSPFSQAVIANGLRLATAFDAKLTVFHTLYRPQDPYYNADLLNHAVKGQRKTEAALAAMNSLVGDSPVAWQPLITTGEPVAELATAVRRQAADLIVAASHGISGWKRMFIGTVVERMARSLPVPILITHTARDTGPDDPPADRYRKLLAACAATNGQDPIIERAACLAHHFGAELHICHVMESPLAEDVLSPTDGPYEKVQAALQQRLKTRLQAMVPQTYAAKTPPTAVIAHGLPSEALLHYARDYAPDLTIVGVRREGILKKRVIGSTTEALLRRTHHKTLVVPLKPDL